ncbi:MAG: hypothetical protein HXX18_00940 [Bacteroidetes bacterium]|nr:hypothetical protein [Bacteroidota bacterium]
MKIKKQLIVFIWGLCPLILIAQDYQSGYVFEINSDNKPIPNVEIIALKSSIANSDDDGHFRLAFRNKKGGEPILIDQINKKGYELVNKEDVQNWVFSMKYPVKIIMCKEGLLAESKRKYYNIGSDYYKKRYEESIAAKKKQLQKNNITQQDYLKAIDDANQELKKSQENLNFYVDKFSRINKDELYGTDKLAIQLLEEGKIDEAIIVYEDSKILETFIEKLKQRDNASYNLRVMAPLLFNQVDLLIQKNDMYSHMKADSILHAIAKSDTLNTTYTNKYALFLMKEENYSESFLWYKTTLLSAKTEEQKKQILNDLNTLYSKIEDNGLIEKYKYQIDNLMK